MVLLPEKVKLNILSNSLSPFINGFITRKKINNIIVNDINLSLSYLTPDKGITKKILQKGDRAFPTKGQLVTVVILVLYQMVLNLIVHIKILILLNLF